MSQEDPKTQQTESSAKINNFLFIEYQNTLIHNWSRITATFGWSLIPLFFILDFFVIPANSKDLLPQFGIYRLVTTLVVLGQFFVIRKTSPGKFSFLHGYFFNVVVSIMIIQMTVDLGGFNSSYYAGLNLVIIAVNLLIPWAAHHSAINGITTIALYMAFNAIWGREFHTTNLINNFYFMSSTVFISAGINMVKFKLIREEFFLRQDLIESYKHLDESRRELKAARDALWGEMEIAKRIQTALLPADGNVGAYEVAATMLPAEEVGGDYYDIILNEKQNWVTIGDVSGHGVESGLIMMMTQTSIKTLVDQQPEASPAEILASVNGVIKENISRLGADRYMTISAFMLKKDRAIFAGKHQDVLIYRHAQKKIEKVESQGIFIGVIDNIKGLLKDIEIPVEKGDIMLFFTDGATEAENSDMEMFGQERLEQSLLRHASLSTPEIIQGILKDVRDFQNIQDDDITLVILRKNE